MLTHLMCEWVGLDGHCRWWMRSWWWSALLCKLKDDPKCCKLEIWSRRYPLTSSLDTLFNFFCMMMKKVSLSEHLHCCLGKAVHSKTENFSSEDAWQTFCQFVFDILLRIRTTSPDIYKSSLISNFNEYHMSFIQYKCDYKNVRECPKSKRSGTGQRFEQYIN